MPGITNPLDPIGSQVEQMSIDRQRQIATMLQQQSMTPLQGQMIGPHWVAPSWTQLAAKLAEGLSGKSMNDDLDKKMVQYQNGTLDSLTRALGPQGGASPQSALAAGAQAGSVGPTVANAARMDAQPAQTPSPLNPLGIDPQMAARMLLTNPEKYWELQGAAYKPTEATLMARQGGLDPVKTNADAVYKANYVQPMDVKPGGTLFSVKEGRPIFNAPEANGNYLTFDGANQPTMRRAPGADASVAAAKAAELSGENGQKLLPESLLPTNTSGTKRPMTVGQAVTAANGGFPAGTRVPAPTDSTGGPIVPGQSDRLTLLQQERAKETDPKNIAALDREISRLQPPELGAKYGQEKGATDAQNALDKRWSDLQAQNSTAETNNSYLQNIKELAVKAAVGPQADKINLLNGLLSLVGNEKATGAVTDKNLIDKYSNQIIARLGQGSLGTDAARSIIEAANPNSKMTKEAISEAVDNLVGANKMIQAKTQLLSQHGNARDPSAYSEKEIKFDQAADPRIWQYAAMKPEQRAAFKAKLAQQGGAQEFGQKIRTLESLGVKF